MGMGTGMLGVGASLFAPAPAAPSNAPRAPPVQEVDEISRSAERLAFAGLGLDSLDLNPFAAAWGEGGGAGVQPPPQQQQPQQPFLFRQQPLQQMQQQAQFPPLQPRQQQNFHGGGGGGFGASPFGAQGAAPLQPPAPPSSSAALNLGGASRALAFALQQAPLPGVAPPLPLVPPPGALFYGQTQAFGGAGARRTGRSGGQ
jgi:hypothetical protein